ncbi:unnamed protein product [Tuber aestivum]|uniref:Uncharacterized protein n=1 Tax=Tuber aestivum TaxID=59557 RepID=A0A292PY79_9PEZI|nr:unnamed protein product [Tuber aestivum]
MDEGAWAGRWPVRTLEEALPSMDRWAGAYYRTWLVSSKKRRRSCATSTRSYTTDTSTVLAQVFTVLPPTTLLESVLVRYSTCTNPSCRGLVFGFGHFVRETFQTFLGHGGGEMSSEWFA